MRVRIEVRLRKGVTDPEGENVRKALQLLGFSDVVEVASAKRFLIEMNERSADRARAAADEMCQKLLANPVIHEYTIEVEPAGPVKRPAAARRTVRTRR